MSTFKGVVCTKIAKDVKEGIENLKVLDVERKPLGDFEVRVRVHATSLNFFDLLLLVGKYQHKPKLPFVVASEASGEIIETGKKVKHLKLGDAVLFGMTVGSLGEEVVVNAGFCLKKPPSLTHRQAAGLFVGFSTAYNGLIQRGNLKEGEYCLVTGAGGGMGASAIQVAKKVGAIVIAAASSDEKLAVAKKVGADHIINYSKEDMKSAVEKITNGKYCNVIYDVVGGEVFDKCIRCIGDEGRLLVIGFASGTIPKIPANIVLVKGFSVVGVRAGESMRRHPEYAMEMYGKLLEWCAEDSSKIAPYVEHTYTLENYKEAFKLLNDGKMVGKAVIEWIKPVSKL